MFPAWRENRPMTARWETYGCDRIVASLKTKRQQLTESTKGGQHLLQVGSRLLEMIRFGLTHKG
jgi:hypothetical protein